jgi:hypothetical protein
MFVGAAQKLNNHKEIAAPKVISYFRRPATVAIVSRWRATNYHKLEIKLSDQENCGLKIKALDLIVVADQSMRNLGR